MEDCDKKRCIICGKEYTRQECPQSFERMVTCGRVKCTGIRRFQKQRERYLNYLKNRGESYGKINMV